MIDPVCIIHGKKASEHQCLYCCLCFISLTSQDCSIDENGDKQDVCKDCCEKEKLAMLKHV